MRARDLSAEGLALEGASREWGPDSAITRKCLDDLQEFLEERGMVEDTHQLEVDYEDVLTCMTKWYLDESAADESAQDEGAPDEGAPDEIVLDETWNNAQTDVLENFRRRDDMLERTLSIRGAQPLCQNDSPVTTTGVAHLLQTEDWTSPIYSPLLRTPTAKSPHSLTGPSVLNLINTTAPSIADGVPNTDNSTASLPETANQADISLAVAFSP